jgi:hypothetical protein
MCRVPNASVPSGWVVTAISSSSNCTAGGPGNPAYFGATLKLPTNGLVVCASSPLPSGWALGTRVSTSACNGEWGFQIHPV